MPRDRLRVCLQDGLKLDLNRLAHRGFIQRGAKSGPISSYCDKEIASGIITADMSGTHEGWFHLRSSSLDLDQRITLVARPRYFGGKQWYFMCPATGRLASVLWMPPGARQFCSRHAWGRIAYRSQFQSVYDRGHAGQAKIKARLIGDLDPHDWDLPPKPKWMRWRTYNRLAERFDVYEDMTYPDDSTLIAAAKRLGRWA